MLSFIFYGLLSLAPAATLASTTTVDDTDSSHFHFDDNWNAVFPGHDCPGCSTKPDTSQAHGGSWHDGTGAGNSNAGLTGSFTFSGTGVTLYGIDDRNPGNIVFSLDDGSPVTYNPTKTDNFQYNRVYFQASKLQNQDHTLTFHLQTKTDGSDGTVSLFDYADIEVPDPQPPAQVASTTQTQASNAPTTEKQQQTTQAAQTTTSQSQKDNGAISPSSGGSPSSSSSTSSAGSSGSSSGTVAAGFVVTSTGSAVTVTSPGSIPSGSTEPTINGASAGNFSNSANKAALIGGIVGGVLGALIVLAACICFIRHQRRKRDEKRFQTKAAMVPYLAPKTSISINTLSPNRLNQAEMGQIATPTAATAASPASTRAEGTIMSFVAGTETSSSARDIPSLPEKSEAYAQALEERMGDYRGDSARYPTNREQELEARLALLEERLYTVQQTTAEQQRQSEFQLLPPPTPGVAPPPYLNT